MTHQADGKPYQVETGGTIKMGPVHNTSSFGFCSYPDAYGASGMYTYIINQGNQKYIIDNGGRPITQWPTNEEPAESFTKVD